MKHTFESARGRFLAGSAVLLSLGAVGLGATFVSAQTTDTSGMGAYGTGWVTTTNASGTATGSADGSAGVAATPIYATSTIPLPVPGQAPAPTVVSIDTDGKVLIRGIVTATGSDSITIRSWGGIWTIRSSGDGATTVMPQGAGGASDLSMVRMGDFVGVDGLVSRTADMTVNASFVRDWTTNPLGAGGSVSGSVSTGAQAGTGGSAAGIGNASSESGAAGIDTNGGTASGNAIGSSTATGSVDYTQYGLPADTQLYTGTISNADASAGTFTLTTDSGQTYTVQSNPNTTSLWDTGGQNVNFSDFQNGHAVRLNATASGNGTLSASVIRDTMLGTSASGNTNASGGSTDGTSGS